MPASTAQLTRDLESLLHRALSRSGTGAWEAALEAIERAGRLMSTLLARPDRQESALRRSAQLLGDLRARFVQAQDAAREELDQLRYARARLRPTRNAYRRPAASSQRRFDGTA